MKIVVSTIIKFSIVAILIIPNFYNISASSFEDTPQSSFEENKEVYLMRGEHYIHLNAKDDVENFNLRFAFPPDYQYQVPILLELYDDTSANLLNYKIEEDINYPNKVINFSIGAMKNNDTLMLHFSCWVIVQNHEFEDLPYYVRFPKKSNLPEETKTWLTSTEVVQKNRLLIKLKAHQLRGLSSNLIRFAEKISKFIKNHRYYLFVIQLSFGLFISQDAFTTLLINGENVGRSHLACAFFRSYNVPARVLLVHNDQGFWTQMHYMIEYFCPGYGWVLIDSTKGQTPYATKRQIINRICYPEDEMDTKSDYIYPFMKGEERWLWLNNDNIVPVYVDCNSGSKSQMFYEGHMEPDKFTADYAFLLSQLVYRQYEKYLGLNLTGQNYEYFKNAMQYHLDAINAFQQSNINSYLDYMYLAYNEYLKIIILNTM